MGGGAGPWAKSLLKQFTIGADGQILDELIPYQEIYSSDKTRHFQALQKTTGIKSKEGCGCKKRQAALNKWVPFHKNKKKK